MTAGPTTKRQSTEAALLDAAREVFAELGYLNAKISDITSRAGRSIGSFYNYYETKQQLLEALLERFPAEIVERTRDELTDDWGANVEAAVRAYFRTFRDYLPEMIGVFQLSMTDASAAAWWRAQRAYGIRSVLALIGEVEKGGTAVDLDHAVFASAIVSMLESYCWTWMAAGGDDVDADIDEETAVHTLAEMWRRAMLNSASPTPLG
ncbi:MULTISPECIES: TetR/AcrR family transcriptional regulator [unclassified Mycobacterium]|uniref:TetR/AcrR family transcriptional regulator n=1 Tax=unclassified Mycobacterium TaxID=2642494 RepID=UPI0029C6C85C|nr:MULTISPECIES: TetR/AcrR family transcriptional regulator [unclassified Mycobacterium]